MKCLAMFVVLLLPFAAQAQDAVKCSVQYENRNQIDYGPLVFRRVSGHVVDRHSVQMRGGCMGIFAEENHKLIASTMADETSNFSLPTVPPGRYRLVARFDGLCAANVPLRIVRWPRGQVKRELVLHITATGIDICSYGAYK